MSRCNGTIHCITTRLVLLPDTRFPPRELEQVSRRRSLPRAVFLRREIPRGCGMDVLHSKGCESGKGGVKCFESLLLSRSAAAGVPRPFGQAVSGDPLTIYSIR